MHKDSFHAKDGTRLAIHRTGQGPLEVVLANGLGGPFFGWRPILDRFASECSFYSWDYRGLYGSDAPHDRDTLSVECAVEDQIALMEHFGLEKVVVGGWSMGVQVALEFYRRYPERVAGMFLLNGTYGKIFNTAFRTPFSQYLLPPALLALRRIAPFAGFAIRRFANWSGTIPLAAKLRLVDPRIDREVFRQVAKEFGRLDLDLYFDSLNRLSLHDAEDVLPTVEVPVLIIAAEHDMMTPADVTEKMVREMRRAELFIVPGGSHYCLLEYPDIVSDRLRRFLVEHFSADSK